MAIIEINELDFSYQENVKIFEQLNFAMEEGKTVGIIGANGAGKSTFLRLIMGLLPDYHGILRVCGMDVNKKNLANVRKKLGYVLQDSESQLFLSTVYEDVAFGPRNEGLSESEVKERVDEALQKVHIEDLANRQVYRMSGGQKKLAAIATILSMRPTVILMDEPSIALDPKNRRNLINVLNEMGGTKIIASHDLDLIYDVCDEVVLLGDKKIVATGAPQEILANQALLENYGLELPLSMQQRR